MSLLAPLLSGREELRTEQMIKKTQNLAREGTGPKKRPVVSGSFTDTCSSDIFELKSAPCFCGDMQPYHI